MKQMHVMAFLTLSIMASSALSSTYVIRHSSDKMIPAEVSGGQEPESEVGAEPEPEIVYAGVWGTPYDRIASVFVGSEPEAVTWAQVASFNGVAYHAEGTSGATQAENIDASGIRSVGCETIGDVKTLAFYYFHPPGNGWSSQQYEFTCQGQ